MNTTKQFLIIILVTTIICFSLGFFLGANFYKKGNTLIKSKNTFQAGWDTAKQRLVEAGLSPRAEQDIEINKVKGEVLDIKNNKVSLKISPLEILADPDLDYRIVNVNNTTKISFKVPKNKDKYKREVEEFEQKMSTFDPRSLVTEGQDIEQFEMPKFPESYIFKLGKLSNIKVGDNIIVIASENIKNSKKFNADEIIIQ